MTTRRTIEIAAVCAALLLAALIFHAWLAAHDDQLRLASTLATQKQALDAADARERDRNSTLKDALAQINTLKHNAQNETPAQLARALQEALQLPLPITIGTASRSDSSVGARHAVPERTNSTAAPLSNDAQALDVRTAGVSPAPLPSSTTLQAPQLHRKKPSATNHFSTHSSTALQAQNLLPIAPTLSPGKPRRPRQTRKAKTTHHRKTSRELPRHFPPPIHAPRIDRPLQVPQAPRPPPRNPPPKFPPPISPLSTTTSRTVAPANSNSPPPN